MISGAGSGKTTSLVKALNYTIASRGAEFRKWGQKAACITYTEIAAKEIWNDVGNTPLSHVSTIHSFLWTLIAPYQKDIRNWVSNKITAEIAELQAEAAAFTARVQAHTRAKNQRKTEKLRAYADDLSKTFIYGTGRNYTKGILGHDDIIKMVPELILSKPLLRSIIAQSYPVVFIDESQDTLPEVVAAFKAIAADQQKFCLGFFGDPMQKIYTSGIGNVPAEQGWRTIAKPENFRCSTSVISVVNNIRAEDDGLVQEPGENNREKAGSARIFILPADNHRNERLAQVKSYIARVNNDPEWETEDVKLLVIVHRMAAIRLEFSNLYEAIHDKGPQELKDGLLDGTAWPLKPFLKFVLPLVKAQKAGKNFDVVEILRELSPLFGKDKFKGQDVAAHLASLKQKITGLTELFDRNTTIGDVLRHLRETGLYELDGRFEKYLAPQPAEQNQPAEEPAQEVDDEAMTKAAVQAFLECPVADLSGYERYVDEQSPFATQHGVKGTEFNRVLTICDDDEGSYNLYSYDKLFGIEPLSRTDIENLNNGRDNAVTRTRRLFYVCCSRAEKDLAIVYFVANPDAAVAQVRAKGYFTNEQILTLDQLAN